MIQTKAPQWKEQLEASRNPSNSHAQGLLAASHSQGYPSGRVTPTHLEMVRSMWMPFLAFWAAGQGQFGALLVPLHGPFLAKMREECMLWCLLLDPASVGTCSASFPSSSSRNPSGTLLLP